MGDWRRQYWADCISGAASECELALSTAQLDTIARAVEGAHEVFGMASGDDLASMNFSARQVGEADALRRQLARERAKVMCQSCGGRGRLIYQSGPWACNTSCSKCHGEGRHDP